MAKKKQNTWVIWAIMGVLLAGLIALGFLTGFLQSLTANTQYGQIRGDIEVNCKPAMQNCNEMNANRICDDLYFANDEMWSGTLSNDRSYHNVPSEVVTKKEVAKWSLDRSIISVQNAINNNYENCNAAIGYYVRVRDKITDLYDINDQAWETQYLSLIQEQNEEIITQTVQEIIEEQVENNQESQATQSPSTSTGTTGQVTQQPMPEEGIPTFLFWIAGGVILIFIIVLIVSARRK